MINRSKAYKQSKAEIERLGKKYDLYEDGEMKPDYFRDGSENYEDRKRAQQRMWEQRENMESLKNSFKSAASKKAGQKIVEKYGETALSDIEYHNKRSYRVFLSVALPLTVASIGYDVHKANGKH